MFVKNWPAVKLKKTVIIADLHIGIERKFWKNNITVPKQTKLLAKRVMTLIKKLKTKRMIVVGDVKDTLYSKDFDKQELFYFFEKLKNYEIIIVKGNHDGNLEKELAQFTSIKIVPSFSIDHILLTHGHKNITKCSEQTIIIGHNHLGVKLKDALGGIFIEPCWVVGNIKIEGEKKKLIIMPPFNQLCGLTPVNNLEGGKLLGPIAKKIDIKAAKIYLVDGTYLGRLKDIENQ